MPYKGPSLNVQTVRPVNIRGDKEKPVISKKKSITYTATSDQIFAIGSDAGATSVKDSIPARVEVENTGNTVVTLMVGYQEYSSDTAVSGNTEYLHLLLKPGETYLPPVSAIIRTGESKNIMDGSVVSNQAPDSNEYTDSGADVDSATADGIVGSNSSTLVYLEPYTSAANCTANLFFVGDLIRVNNEIMEVTAIADKSDLANNYLTVIRGTHGSTKASDHADDAAVRLPFFNAFHQYDKFSVCCTDRDGKLKITNGFGLGRSQSGVQGIVPGSFSMKFYQPGSQSLGLHGITPSTESGLVAGRTYYLKVEVDGSGDSEEFTFTVDSTDTTMGSVVQKIQEGLDAKFYDDTSNNGLYEKKVFCTITDGDVVFTSGQHLSTSAISLAAGAGGADTTYEILAAVNGRFPVLANINASVAARLPDDVKYDPITYASSPNPVFAYDDGYGKIKGVCDGDLNYETGALTIYNAPPLAEFTFSLMHTSAFSGKANEAVTSRMNTLKDVYANVTNQKEVAELDIRTY
jgi:hypothetical protein